MKSFLKIALLVVVAVIAVKLLPLTLAAGSLLALMVGGLAVAGVSLLAGLFIMAVVAIAVLAPVWIPVLLVIGLIALIKRCTRRQVAA